MSPTKYASGGGSWIAIGQYDPTTVSGTTQYPTSATTGEKPVGLATSSNVVTVGGFTAGVPKDGFFDQKFKNMMGEYQVTARKLEKSLEKTRIDMVKLMRGVSQFPNRRQSGGLANPTKPNYYGCEGGKEYPPDD